MIFLEGQEKEDLVAPMNLDFGGWSIRCQNKIREGVGFGLGVFLEEKIMGNSMLGESQRKIGEPTDSPIQLLKVKYLKA